MKANRFKIQPEVIWFMESENHIRILQTQTGSVTITTAFETCLWNSIWQGFPLSMWEGIDEESAGSLQTIIARWKKEKLLIEDEVTSDG